MNWAIGRFMAKNGAVVVRHKDLEMGIGVYRGWTVSILNRWASIVESGVARVWRDARV